ncbi:MAG: F0F1 ATP synthase subunit B [Rhodospirillaceae bacterium]
MIQDPTFWVGVAFVIFFAFAVKKAGATVLGMIDQRGARIRKELEEAQRLREDAEKVLAECQSRQAETEAEAEKILAYAREEAERVLRRADEEAQSAVRRREAQAVDRIAQAEAQALLEVRNVAVDIAINASRRLFEERVAKGQADPLVDRTIKTLGGLLN